MHSPSSSHRSASGFTLVELVVVILIVAIVYSIVTFQSGAFTYWQREGAVRRLSETITFLHHRAITDGVFYRMEFSMAEEDGLASYRVGEIVAEGEDQSDLAALSSSEAGIGILSLQLADFLTPSTGAYQNMIEPRSFPSLAKPVELPVGLYFEDIKTPRGLTTLTDYTKEAKPYILFSPRGFSEFAVIHLMFGEELDGKLTLLVNPFTGLTEIYRDYRDFEWTYGRDQQ